MDRRRVLALLAFGGLLVMAGCQTPGTPQDGAFAPDVSVVNVTGHEQGTTIPVAGNETVDPGAVFSQVQGLLDSDVPPPANVRVLDDLDSLSTNATTIQSPVRRHLNVTQRGDLDLGDQENGAVNNFGGITIYPGERRDPQATTWVLAHELVHYVQVRGGVFARLQEEIGIDTTDGQFTYRAMLEGPAVYTTEAYLDEYLPGANTTLDLYNRIDRGLPPGSAGTYANRQYLLGYDYVRGQVDSPAALDRLYNNTAVTSEQLIHGYDPSAEPMAALDVDYRETDAWSVTGRDRMGEAFVWAALEDRLGTERARAAAAGWGNDTMLTIYPTDEGNASFAWVQRWDDAANATEFARDARTYLERAGTSEGMSDGTSGGTTAGTNEGTDTETSAGELTRLQTGAYATLETAGDRTTVMLVGERDLVADTSIAVDGPDVSLETAAG